MIQRLIKIIILFVILLCTNSVYALDGRLEYNVYGYKFKPSDKKTFLQKANSNLELYFTTESEAEKKFYLQEATKYYFLLTKIDNNSINAHIGLGKIYDEMGLDKFSQEHFFKAYNINRLNPELNLSFGDYYFKRKNYIKALNHYKAAYNNGYVQNLTLNKKMAVIYEKLADLQTSREYYINALRLDESDESLAAKIRQIDKLDYFNSQYYLFLK